MDKNTISILEDYKSSIQDSFKRMDKKFKSVNKSDKSQKKADINSLKQELANIKSNYSLMKSELESLNSPEIKSQWEETASNTKQKMKSYDKKIKELESEAIISSNPDKKVDHLDVDAKVDYNQLNVQEVMERGNKILDVDDDAIKNMAHVVGNDVDQMKKVNQELNAQQEKLDNVNTDLTEIDYSLKRAGKQISNMFKIYSSDKCITGLIVVILIIIVVIIIVSACGGDDEKNFNVPHDIFGTNNNSTHNSGEFIITNKFRIINFIGLIMTIFEFI